ncbi:hypothetical protein Fmac_019138 [Flemingia macrophylla]|uniref:Uncharacterized protein n=1 Tax=Flemingia macrophylla TaxID=520843 RepID=A0ABD1M6X7_9FABA
MQVADGAVVGDKVRVVLYEMLPERLKVRLHLERFRSHGVFVVDNELERPTSRGEEHPTSMGLFAIINNI